MNAQGQPLEISERMIYAAIEAVGGTEYKISAIKEMRVRYDIGLREAKDLVETIIIPMNRYQRTIQSIHYTYDWVTATSEAEANRQEIPAWIQDLAGTSTVLKSEVDFRH
mgnify:CR=1 FL=1|jgi:hypothetical protein